MFVSNYNTFVQPNSTQKVDKQKLEKINLPSEDFSSKLSQKTSISTIKTTPTQISNNYNQNSFHAKQELQKLEQKEYNPVKESLTKFSGKNSLLQAATAYNTNSKMFSLVKVPTSSLNQIHSLDKTLPREPREIKEANIRYKMINTYIANDNYFKVTA